MRPALLSAVLAAGAAWGNGSTYSVEAPSSVAGGAVAGALVAGVVVWQSSSHGSRATGAAFGTCARDSDCTSGNMCEPTRGECVRRDSAAVSQRRDAIALWLRDRVVEVREELALGRGPVIGTLANAAAVPAPTLGRALRANRAELLKLIGDGSDVTWSARFLHRVEELAAAPQRS